jgi:hypothetical protein
MYDQDALIVFNKKTSITQAGTEKLRCCHTQTKHHGMTRSLNLSIKVAKTG